MIEPNATEQDELEGDDADFDPAPLSFFADARTDRSKLTPHELADVHDRDDRISTNVYRIYLGKLSDRGLMTPKDAGRAYTRAQLNDTNARARRRAALSPERHEPKEQPPMPKHEDNDEERTASSAARDAAVSLAKANGRPPTIVEIKRAIAKAYPEASGSLIRQTLKRAGIPFTSVRNSATDQKKDAAPKPPARASRAEVSDVGAPIGSSLAIMALQGQRAKVVAQLEAIDSVIEALRR